LEFHLGVGEEFFFVLAEAAPEADFAVGEADVGAFQDHSLAADEESAIRAADAHHVIPGVFGAEADADFQRLIGLRIDGRWGLEGAGERAVNSDRKSTRLNFSHGSISYAVFCL